MQKRGQVAAFVIIGIVLIIALMLVFFLRGRLREEYSKIINKQEYLNSQLGEIQNVIDKCIVKETNNAANLIGDSGGYFNPVSYVSYHGKKISILCNNIPDDKKCNAKPLNIEDVNKRFNEYLKNKVKNCINLNAFENQKYTLTKGQFDLVNYIQNDRILVEVNYPITLKLDEFEVKKAKFTKKLSIPLGTAIMLANEIISSEAISGEFDVMTASLLSRGMFTIRQRNSYPAKIYIIDLWDGKYKFNLAIEGEY